ncbi:MAG: RIP metalloprotease RseP [Thiomicrospira sp.]|jgi:regulator of sigma E protease|nr:RIP metalloprotease RseP [Thiomicrospira sp.]
MDVVWALVGFALIIGVLVTIHEWGHFIVARLFNVQVLTFSVGFGRPIFSVQRGETRYQLGMIPLGGYVKFLDEREASVAPALLPRAFNRLSVYKRFAIVFAGPAINVVFAWLLFSLINLLGVMAPKPIFDQPDMNSPMAQALRDVQAPVELRRLGDQPVHTWSEVQQVVVRALVEGETRLALSGKTLVEQQPVEGWLSLSSLDVNNTQANWLSELGFRPYQPPVAPIVAQVMADSPAAHIGLRPNDKIVALDAQPVADWQAVVDYVKIRPNQTVALSFVREGAVFTQKVQLASVSQGQQVVGQLGVKVDAGSAFQSQYFHVQQLSWGQAFVAGWQKTVDLSWMTLVMFKRMVLGDVSLAHLSGPISIAQFSGQALQTGLVSFLGLMALLSLSLGILNLLPIPMLDGGHLMYYFLEMMRGRPLSEQAEALGFRVGFVLIIMLTFLAITNDVIKFTNG